MDSKRLVHKPESLAVTLKTRLLKDPFWKKQINRTGAMLHLGIFIEPYLDLIVRGKKKLESRFSIKPCPPYGCVKSGDILFLKKSGGPVIGVCQIGCVVFHSLRPGLLSDIRRMHSTELCIADTNFWDNKLGANYATLLELQNVHALNPFPIEKRDRRGWVVLRP